MARHLKDRPWTEAEQAWRWAQSLAAKRSLFEIPMIGNLMIMALVMRIERKNPKEARFLMRNIKTVVAMERCCQIDAQLMPSLEPLEPPSALSIDVNEFLRRGLGGVPMPPSELSKDVNELMALLREIVKAKVPKRDHDWRTLSDQRKWLIEYSKGYPIRPSLPPRQYKAWLIKHSTALYQGLCSFDCLCEYRDSLNEITEHDLRDCKGPAPLIEILLAQLHHNLTQSAVRRRLSHSTGK